MERKIVFNGRVFASSEVLENGMVIIDENGRIESILEIHCDKKNMAIDSLIRDFSEKNRIDAWGGIIAPGSIDLHTHGFGGYDVMNGDIIEIARSYVKYGVTSFSPTVITARREDICSVLDKIVEANKLRLRETGIFKGAAILPVHLECNWLNKEKAGSHNTDYLFSPDINLFYEYAKASEGFIGIVTIAPELEGVSSFVASISGHYPHMVFSAGHTCASRRKAQESVEIGFSLWNHVYNRMSNEDDYSGYRHFCHDRMSKINAVDTGLESESVYAEIIADFVHVNEHYIRLAIQRKGCCKIILVSDAIAAAGSSEKTCMLNGKRVLIYNNGGYEAAYYEDGTLCGSTLTLDQAIRNVNSLNLPLEDAIMMASLNPARALGIDRQRGSIEAGKYADIAVYEDDHGSIGEVMYTLVQGVAAFP